MCANDDSGFCEWNGPPEKPAAGREPERDRHRDARAPVLLGGDRHQVIPGAGDEVRELHLRDRTQPHHRRARRAAHDRRLGERRVDDAPRTELLLEALGDLEGPAVDPDVLADQEHAPVVAHLEPEPVADRLEIGLLGHRLSSHVVRRVELLGLGVDAVEQRRGIRGG